MPVISSFFGMLIRLYHGDHPPPHIHVQYGDEAAVVKIADGSLLAGRLPGRLISLLKIWIRQHRMELLSAWKNAEQLRPVGKIKPLE